MMNYFKDMNVNYYMAEAHTDSDYENIGITGWNEFFKNL